MKESLSPPDDDETAADFTVLTINDLILLGFTVLLALALLGASSWASYWILGHP